MNPDFLKYLQQITSALRSGITLGGDPLGELQKRASQIGEGFGSQFEHDRAQAGYTNALIKQYSGGEPGLRGQVRGQLDPHTQRAQQETMQNAAMLALGSLKPEASIETVAKPVVRYAGKVYEGPTHADAALSALQDNYPSKSLKELNSKLEEIPEKDMGFSTNNRKFVSRLVAEKIQKAAGKLSPQVQAQMAARTDQAGKPMGLTAEDLKGKLYANRGTQADAPMTLDDLNRIMAKRHAGNSDAEGVLAQESVRGATAHPLADALSKIPHNVSETIKSAAVMMPDGTTVFEGPVHAEAMLKAKAAGFHNLYEPDIPRGYTTSHGRFVDQDEAYRIADAQDQINNEGRQYADKHNDRSLESGMLQPSKRYGPTRTTVGPNEAVPPFWGTRLHSALTDKGGFTIDPETGADLTSGYSVGGGEKSGVLLKKPLADLKPTELQSFMNANKSKLQPGQAWGGWVQDGHVYVEPADQVGDLNEAQRLGNERGEQAIWDHANGKEIPLKAAKADAAAQTAAAQEPYRDVLDKWHSAWGDFTNGIAQLPKISQERGADVLAAKKFPSSNATQPWLASYLQRDIERPNGVNAKKLGDVEDIAYKTFNTPQFKKWLAAGQGTGTWYDTRETMGRAIDALGEKLGPKAFNEFIDHLAASTAMSRPENNIRRASWWRALNLQGLLNPEELRSSTLAAPEGMGHIAQRAHHFATADLVENGTLNALANPKPASFAENLKMNQRPVTFDTRMSNAALSTNPKMSLGLAGVRDDATPRKWAYAPIERAAQRVAAEAHARGDLDPVPRGVDPTATWQAQVWGGIGRADKTHMMSTDNPSFHAILDNLLARSAKLWGVSPTKANELFWKGQPLDLPLDASLLKGPSRKR